MAKKSRKVLVATTAAEQDEMDKMRPVGLTIHTSPPDRLADELPGFTVDSRPPPLEQLKDAGVAAIGDILPDVMRHLDPEDEAEEKDAAYFRDPRLPKDRKGLLPAVASPDAVRLPIGS